MRAAAEALAEEIAGFPEGCMRADRASAFSSFDHPLPEAMLREFEGGLAALEQEGRAGAARFAGGAGRHGDFGR